MFRNFLPRQKKHRSSRSSFSMLGNERNRRCHFEALENRRMLTIVLTEDLLLGDDLGGISPTGIGTRESPYVYDFAGESLHMGQFDIRGVGRSFRFEGLGLDSKGYSILYSGDGGNVDVSNSSGYGGTVEIIGAAGAVELSSIITTGDSGGKVTIDDGAMGPSSSIGIAGEIDTYSHADSLPDSSGQASVYLHAQKVAVLGDIRTASRGLDAGDVTIIGQTSIHVTAGKIAAEGWRTAGNIEIRGPGVVELSGADGISINTQGARGKVSITTDTIILRGDIDTSTGSSVEIPNSVSLVANSISLHGDVVTSSQDAGGDIKILATREIDIQSDKILATGVRRGGNLEIIGPGSVLVSGHDGKSIITRGSGGGGNITIQVDSIFFLGGIDSSSGQNGGSINLLADAIELHGDIVTSSNASDSGNVRIAASESIDIFGGMLLATAPLGLAGDIEISGPGKVSFQGLDADGWSIQTNGSGNSGSVILKSDVVTLAGGINATADATSGSIQIEGKLIELYGELSTVCEASDAGSITVLASEMLDIRADTILAFSVNRLGYGGDIEIRGPGSILLNGEDAGGWSVNSSGIGVAGSVVFEVDGQIMLSGGIDARNNIENQGGTVNLSGHIVEVMGTIKTGWEIHLEAANTIYLGSLDVDPIRSIVFDAGGSSSVGNQLLNFDTLSDPQEKLDSPGAVFYDPTIAANDYLDSRQYPLASGGVLRPTNKPPEADAGGPYTISEGESLSLDASGSTDADGDPLTYRWDIDGDGDYDENVTGVAPNVPWSSLISLGIDDGPDSRAVTVEVSDGFEVSTHSTSLTIENVAPTVSLNTVTDIDENDSVDLVGSYIDPGVSDSHDIVVKWDDDNAADATFSLPAINALTAGSKYSASSGGAELTVVSVDALIGEVEFTVSHQYLDDGVAPGNATSSDSSTIEVIVTDDDQASGSDDVSFLVQNLAPEITSFSSDATFTNRADEGEAITVSATFTDVGTLDEHAATIDWGDGTTSPGVVSETNGSGTVSASHVYAAGGIYSVTVALNDDDLGAALAETTAVITGVGLNEGVLYIIGTSDADEISVNQFNRDQLKVHATFLTEESRTFNVSDVEKIVAYLFEGDDELNISRQVTIPAIIHGGDDNDLLSAGGGPTVLLGDQGNDTLNGNIGRSILIGGTGADRLVGGRDSDILIGSSTDQDQDDTALMAALAAWASDEDDYQVRVAAVDLLLTVEDDQDEDRLTGSSGRDLYYQGLSDALTDVELKKELETVL